MNEEKNYLGIDWGMADLGLALADAETRMAFAYDSLPNDDNLMSNLVEITSQENVGKVIIGIPVFANSQEGENKARKLGEKIKKEINVEVYYQNEMFTTKMAESNLKEKGAKNIKTQDDKESARIILQEWLDNNSKK